MNNIKKTKIKGFLRENVFCAVYYISKAIGDVNHC